MPIFNFNNKEEFAKFIELSNENYVLKNLFNNDDEDVEGSAKKWLKTVNRIISLSFSKVRIRKGKINPEVESLLQRKKYLKAELAVSENYDDVEKCIVLEDDIENITQKISDICSDKNKQIVDEYIGDVDSSPDGFNQIKTWGLKKQERIQYVVQRPTPSLCHPT